MTRFLRPEPSDKATAPSDGQPDGILLLDREQDESVSSTESVGTSRTTTVAVVGLVVLVVGVLIALSSGGGSSTGDGGQAAQLTVEQRFVESGSAVGGETEAGFVAWPDPPIDHDPHVSGRPGHQLPLREDLQGMTLVYVNDLGRPTVIDLSTGDQREVDIAGPRLRDEFFVEQGKVVSVDRTDTDLPLSEGRAFAFTVHRTAQPGDREVDQSQLLPVMSGPSLCLDEGLCPEVPFTSGTFGHTADQAMAVTSEYGPVKALAEVLGAGWWARDGRWTVFALGASSSVAEVRFPTPMTGAVVWVVSQTTE